ncbi:MULTISPECIES: helix-turn-helix domain-containing protein [Mycobacteriaceae]|uniref:Helix-turn-helix domain-containing protein n=1 Tax=Mycolicibacterium farcinogenes TaxID=1802 RepID=A0ACD1FR88_MYCFR|nr:MULTISPECIES: helix-turn-helix transcriptional regulator [Mycobacteriaceae]MBN7314467.1 helix-turn-helix transcriptional regulator [Mycobacteroides abscessus subsp. abscessus]QZH69579.1 helix-turn-helix domain-containing protein [Mycolicibacterium farcinogenes]
MVPSDRALAAQRIGKAIRDRREVKDLSQRELAKRAGVQSQWLGQIELGKAYPQKRTQIKIETVLEWSLGTLETVGETGEVPEAESAIPQEATDGILGMAQMVIDTSRQAATTLPDPDADPRVYLAMAMNVVRTLSHAGQLLTKGMRASAMGEAMKLVAEINKTKDAVMADIAASPAAMVGHQLYVWRRDSGVDLQTVSEMTGLATERLAELENARPPTDVETRILTKIVGV